MQRELAKSRINAAIQAFRDGLPCQLVATACAPHAPHPVHALAPGRVREEEVVVPAIARRVLLENRGRWDAMAVSVARSVYSVPFCTRDKACVPTL